MPLQSPIKILDGGLGTTLKETYNATVDGENCPLWSSHLLISDPVTLGKAQGAFVEAGAEILLTATYQVSFEGFEGTKVLLGNGDGDGEGYGKSQAEKYMRSAVPIARSAFMENAPHDTAGMVVLGLGAYGAIMIPSQEYTGKYDAEHQSAAQLRDWHAERLAVFEGDEETWKEVDLVAFETVPLREEILGVREAMAGIGKQEGGKKFWISCVFPGEGTCLPDGTTASEVVRSMLGRSPDGSNSVNGMSRPYAIGFNCTKIDKVEKLVEAFESAVSELLLEEGEDLEWPALVLYPDGTRGEVYNTVTHEWEMKGARGDERPWDEILFEIVRASSFRGRWKKIIVGGCCKTGPEEIKALRERVDRLR